MVLSLRMLGGGEGTELRLKSQKLNEPRQYHTVCIKDTGLDIGVAWSPVSLNVHHIT